MHVCTISYARMQEWWSDLWLNEGFASWIEYLCVDHCFPHYDIWTQFATSDFTRALELDALRNSHPIEVSQYMRTYSLKCTCTIALVI